jgi:hypothetical protein
MSFDVETLKRQIPYYLTAPPAQKELVGELKALSGGATVGYFLHILSDMHAQSLLQGDGWSGLQVLSFVSGDRSSVRGIVMSNSCDVSNDNERVLPPKIVFAPIVKLSAIRARFERSGLPLERIDAKIRAIKGQSVTNVFYLPAEGPLAEEYVALLDDVHSMPATAHEKKAKIFTLSQAGFYLFVFKLSVHFCRFQENVDRRSPVASV